MASVNKAILIGKLTNDVQRREVSGGSVVASFNLEVVESYVNKAGDRKETKTQVDIEVWGPQAETCSKYLCKGREVLAEGRLKLDQWQDQEGNKRSRLLVRAKNVKFLDAPPEKKQDPAPEKASAPEQPAEKKEEPEDRGYPADWDDIEVPPFG